MSINFDRALGSHERVLYRLSERTGVLASNLANADTPGYKARDLDFKTALNGARDAGLALSANNSRHFQASDAKFPGGGGPGGELLYRVPNHAALDGNTVEVEMEQAAFAENSVRYQATLQFLRGRFEQMRTALRG
ncbi:MAG: flagellar basal body rod protein FlgB [Porticoccaceae bacterium]